MNDQSSQNQNDEIDLSVLFNKIRSFFKSILIGLVQVFQFFWEHKLRLFILLIIGIGLQLLLKTQVQKIYTNELLVKTNFGSTEYLYGKVKAINTKIESKDTTDLKVIFGKAYSRVIGVEVEPVIDVYSLVNESTESKETFELLLDEFGDFSFVEEKININEYPNHKLKIYVKGKEENESIAKQLYTSLAENSFYNEMRDLTIESLQEQLVENKKIRKQIDSIIKEQKGALNFSTADNNSINFSGSQDLQELLNQKRVLLSSDLKIKEQLSSEDEILKIVDSSFGVLSKERNINYLLIPLFLIGAYSLFFFLKYLKTTISRFVKQD